MNAKQVSASFWAQNPQFKPIRGYTQNDYNATIRSEYAMYVDRLCRENLITQKVASSCTLTNHGAFSRWGWAVQGNYGAGWEDVTYEDTRKAALQMLKDYRLNQPDYPHRIKRVSL